MFAAALMFACAGCEVSIYSTCKRISTKLLRNVTMFLGIIYDVLKCEKHKIIRANQEEVHLQGDEGYRDVRVIQSYPFKVKYIIFFLKSQSVCVCFCLCGWSKHFLSPYAAATSGSVEKVHFLALFIRLHPANSRHFHDHPRRRHPAIARK